MDFFVYGDNAGGDYSSTLDKSPQAWHSQSSVGFLTNCTKNADGTVSGFYFSMEPLNSSTTSPTVLAVRKLDHINLENLSGSTSGGSSFKSSCPLLYSTNLDQPDHEYEITSSYTEFNVKQDGVVIFSFDLNDAGDLVNAPSGYTGGNDFGLLSSYASHSCNVLSVATFTDVTIITGTVPLVTDPTTTEATTVAQTSSEIIYADGYVFKLYKDIDTGLEIAPKGSSLFLPILPVPATYTANAEDIDGYDYLGYKLDDNDPLIAGDSVDVKVGAVQNVVFYYGNSSASTTLLDTTTTEATTTEATTTEDTTTETTTTEATTTEEVEPYIPTATTTEPPATTTAKWIKVEVNHRDINNDDELAPAIGPNGIPAGEDYLAIPMDDIEDYECVGYKIGEDGELVVFSYINRAARLDDSIEALDESIEGIDDEIGVPLRENMVFLEDLQEDTLIIFYYDRILPITQPTTTTITTTTTTKATTTQPEEDPVGFILISKKDGNTKKPLKGVVFEILDADLNVIETVTTDILGMTSTSNLVYGDYYVREKAALEGYVLDEKPFPFSIPLHSGYTLECKNFKGSKPTTTSPFTTTTTNVTESINPIATGDAGVSAVIPFMVFGIAALAMAIKKPKRR